MQFAEARPPAITILADLGLTPKGYVLATMHRPYNTDDPERLREVLAALDALEMPVVLPLHPRTRQRLAATGNCAIRSSQFAIRRPPSATWTCWRWSNPPALILTDSGGVQKEAYFFAVPCVTLRPETEWVETVAAGWNRLAWGDAAVVVAAARGPWPVDPPPPVFGDGHAAERIVRLLETGRANV